METKGRDVCVVVHLFSYALLFTKYIMNWEELIKLLEIYVNGFCDAESMWQYPDEMYMSWMRKVLNKADEFLWNNDIIDE